MNLKYKVIDSKFYNIKEILKVHFEISDRLLVKLKKNNRILLNSISSYVDCRVNIGDVLEVNLDFDETSENIVPTKMDLNILYEDEALLIINKPFGIPVHPSMSYYDNSLSNGVKFYFDSINLKRKIRPVNRLDKNTSGIVIFAKNEYIQEALIKQMKTKDFVKEYIAILEGHLETTSGIINAPISRKNNSIIEREVNPLGETAITHFELIKNFEIINKNEKILLSLVKFRLETGRTHQIRVHSKYISHPILGDSLYGNSSDLITRQALHAYKINFIHPISKKEINIEIDLPEDMKKSFRIKESHLI
jgi:23S rRNA pseudouridine1911/1915/1917 synthase